MYIVSQMGSIEMTVNRFFQLFDIEIISIGSNEDFEAEKLEWIGCKEHERAEKCQLQVSAIHLNLLMEPTRDSQVAPRDLSVIHNPKSLFKVSFYHVKNELVSHTFGKCWKALSFTVERRTHSFTVLKMIEADRTRRLRTGSELLKGDNNRS